MDNNSMFISQTDMIKDPNVTTHEYLHTAGLMDRYYELWCRANTDNNFNPVVDGARSSTVPMGVLPPGHDRDHNAANMMSTTSKDGEITTMQWNIVFNLLGVGGRSEEALATLGVVSIVVDYNFSNNSTRMANNKSAALGLITKKLNQSTNNIAFSSTTAFRNLGGVLLQVPNARTSVLPAYLTTFIIHNRIIGDIFGTGLAPSSSSNTTTDTNQLSNTIQR